MKDNIKVLIKRPGEKWEEQTIPNTLRALQEIVDGYIETVTLTANMVAICNEEGQIRGMKPRCKIVNIDFVGPVILAGRDGEDFTDCPVPLTVLEPKSSKLKIRL